MRRCGLIVCATSLFFSGVACALPIDAVIPKNNDKEINITGYVDGSYNYLLRSNRFTSRTYNRVNDLAENGFTLQQAAVTIAKQPPQGFGGLLNALIGRDAYSISPNGFNPDVFGSDDIGFTIPQAYLQFSKDTYTLYGGEVLSLAGIETYDYMQDINFSRSILNGYAQPGTHVGIRGADQITDQIKLILGLNNGWNTIRQSQTFDALEMGLSYVLNPYFSLLANGYFGKQHLTDSGESGPTGKRGLFDIFATWNVTQKLSLAMNYDYGVQTKAALPNEETGHAVWQGIAGYINYDWTDKWFTSMRGEIFEDTDGYRTGVKQNWRELTLTLGFIPLKNLQIRAETRHDFSNVSSFLDKNGLTVSNNQQSYALEMLLFFL